MDQLQVSDQEFEKVIKLQADARYTYFVKRVADWESAWGLWKDGWVLFADSSGQTGFPFWPAERFAAACAIDEFSGADPEEVDLNDLMEELLPRLKSDSVLAAVFPTPSDRAVLVPPARLRASLKEELEKY